MLATSRQVFAFARDGALPFSSYLHRINPYTRTPIIAVWACAFGAFLVGLLTFAGAAAINAIFAMAVGAQYIAYGVPIACFISARGTERARRGPFSLGRLVCVSHCSSFSSFLFGSLTTTTLWGLEHSDCVCRGGLDDICFHHRLLPFIA